MRRPASYIPAVGLVVQRSIGTRAGQLMTISGVRDVGGGIFNIRGFYPNEVAENGGDAENYTLPNDVRQEAPDGFAVGQHVIISDRVNSPREGHEYDCSVVQSIAGTECVISVLDGPNRVRILWNNGSNSWWLWREYLDPVDPPQTSLLPATPFDNAWRLARTGQNLSVLMDSLWSDIAKPVQTLSRAKSDWGGLIVTRALLRLRRQMPNNYEEQAVKNHTFLESRLWQLTWTAATKR